jgi:hypothetical protein
MNACLQVEENFSKTSVYIKGSPSKHLIEIDVIPHLKRKFELQPKGNREISVTIIMVQLKVSG